jgi:ATP-dependent RNA helicase DeaD
MSPEETSTQEVTTTPNFLEFGFSEPILQAVTDLGFEIPTPIQIETIPHFMAGRDVLGQAQTGTGKTAAFGLPLLSRLTFPCSTPQVLVLTPTRELAIQVAEDFKNYAKHIPGFKVVSVYGGADIRGQLRELKRGVHVVVGTPGRVMDHMRRKTLILEDLHCLVLDEADEMLRMGFLEDVDWILEHAPDDCQRGLFSATLSPAIRKIAREHMNSPEEITIKVKTTTAETIHQRYWLVQGMNKLDALNRILEAEVYDGVLIFARTKAGTLDLADMLENRGFNVAPLNGDIPQAKREKTVDALKRGRVDIIVATDVAARGLDVDRISHVINYDIPHDIEAYVHRIGRTGRAGRSGEAILFLSPREKWMLGAIERATKHKISPLVIPTTKIINEIRIKNYKEKITLNLENEENAFYLSLMKDYCEENSFDPIDVAGALARMVQGKQPLLLKENPRLEKRFERDRDDSRRQSRDRSRPDRGDSRGRSGSDRGRPSSDRGDSRSRSRSERPDVEGRTNFDRQDRRERNEASRNQDRKRTSFEDGGRGDSRGKRTDRQEKWADRFRIEVGNMHGVAPGNIVGAIANETGLESRYIGRIDIQEDHSTVDLPKGMPNDLFAQLKSVRVAGQKLNISNLSEAGGEQADDRPPRSGDRKPRSDDRGPRSSDRKPRSDDRSPRSSDRKPRSDSRSGSKSDSRSGGGGGGKGRRDFKPKRNKR